jgi:predicted aspartyl protease
MKPYDSVSLIKFAKRILLVFLMVWLIPVMAYQSQDQFTDAILLSKEVRAGFTEYDYAPSFAAESLIIPLKRAGRLFMVEARIDNITGNLIFDTGATGLVLNRTYFRDYLIHEEGAASGITGSVSKSGWTTVGNLDISGMTYKKIRADVAELSHIENRRGIKVLGLLGFGMISDFEIIIDLRKSQLELHRTDNNGNRSSKTLTDFKPEFVQQLQYNRNVVILQGKVAGKTLSFCLDTGAETNAISSSSSGKVLNTITVKRRSGLTGAGASGAEVIYGMMNDFTLNDNQIPGMDVVITNLDDLTEAYGTNIDGMLGYSFLNKGVIMINLQKKQFGMTFTKITE